MLGFTVMASVCKQDFLSAWLPLVAQFSEASRRRKGRVVSAAIAPATPFDRTAECDLDETKGVTKCGPISLEKRSLTKASLSAETGRIQLFYPESPCRACVGNTRLALHTTNTHHSWILDWRNVYCACSKARTRASDVAWVVPGYLF